MIELNGPNFLQSVETLFGDANACITINSSQFEAFELFQSICQGCPLAPTLYVLVVEGFGYLLAHSISSSLVCGIALIDSSSQLFNACKLLVMQTLFKSFYLSKTSFLVSSLASFYWIDLREGKKTFFQGLKIILVFYCKAIYLHYKDALKASALQVYHNNCQSPFKTQTY